MGQTKLCSCTVLVFYAKSTIQFNLLFRSHFQTTNSKLLYLCKYTSLHECIVHIILSVSKDYNWKILCEIFIVKISFIRRKISLITAIRNMSNFSIYTYNHTYLQIHNSFTVAERSNSRHNISKRYQPTNSPRAAHS